MVKEVSWMREKICVEEWGSGVVVRGEAMEKCRKAMEKCRKGK